MFVSIPSSGVTVQRSRSHNTVNSSESSNGTMSTMLPSITETVTYNGTTNNSFITAPVEYTDRARSEIKKRLLPNTLTPISSFHDNHTLYSTTTSSSASSYQTSIFSAPTSIVGTIKPVTEVTLEEAIPKTFNDMYTSETLLSSPLLSNGRPNFTKRELLYWELNDIRSLLIIEKLRPEWGNTLPVVLTPNASLYFRFQLLPLCCPDEVIVSTLVGSELYTEANLDMEFKLSSARYIVTNARRRHCMLNGGHVENIMTLSKPEWRNIIENYLLNLAVEAQCRYDFKIRCSEYKKWKAENSQKGIVKPEMPPPKMIPNPKTSLLKKTLLKNFQSKKKPSKDELEVEEASESFKHGKVTLTKDEKLLIWTQCQLQVYQRVGLDWKPDNIANNNHTHNA
ncbi:hypothetical protein KAFR_0H00510 [Kazachstania africana CBS 2517]|uniref:Uncharacterized protein n=1 Tax=Kazachstania africana (strain ATCC 22294 / BCRC 22015 / CBS 2517 / CECT 1963 / NBRC 1671 / NRRL Y-8276) TaxID=1071382 RepID=H2AYQ4_KAZAF|nr:hypothetical protein KAFR_0H00510 [Kazachstania africana CBS 2517]CCF59460.1 hypothetical protein KAFR_0H00510 [Kazachstania africana CBS 2517]